MSLCARSNRVKTLHEHERLFAKVLRFIRPAAKIPLEALLPRRVSQLEEASRVARWLASPELRPPI